VRQTPSTEPTRVSRYPLCSLVRKVRWRLQGRLYFELPSNTRDKISSGFITYMRTGRARGQIPLFEGMGMKAVPCCPQTKEWPLALPFLYIEKNWPKFSHHLSEGQVIGWEDLTEFIMYLLACLKLLPKEISQRSARPCRLQNKAASHKHLESFISWRAPNPNPNLTLTLILILSPALIDLQKWKSSPPRVMPKLIIA
jgi:hypothetical protein